MRHSTACLVVCTIIVTLIASARAQIETVMVSIDPTFQNTQGGATEWHNYCKEVECVDYLWSFCECGDDEVLVKCSCRSNCENILHCTSSGAGEAQARWGDPTGLWQSGLGFSSGMEPDTPVELDEEFYLGRLTHFNYPVKDPAEETELLVSFTVKTPGGDIVAEEVPFTFPLYIDETDNQLNPCPYPSIKPCSDRIVFGALVNQSFPVNEVSYTVILTGFKETSDSSSYSVGEFISDEEDARHAFLFAKITAACPPVCVGGGEFIIRDDNTCGCDCSSLTPCEEPKVFSPSCECVCPDPEQCTNGGTLLPDCTCDCLPCDGVQILDPSDCSCSCPSQHCNSGTLTDPEDPSCPCDCTPLPSCAPNEEVSDTCLCFCPLTNQTCSGDNPLKIENPSQDICNCICDPTITCGQNEALNPETCACECRQDACPNGELILDGCICGDCDEYWGKDAEGYCTNCLLNQTDCLETETLNIDECACLCFNLTCNLFEDGLVIDLEERCSCRNCTAGECYCGNGKVEPGEECDTGEVEDPCCVNCQFTFSSCDDGNDCTAPDRCDGQGNCVSRYKCAPSTECLAINCTQGVGVCVETPYPDGSICGNGNLCENRCEGGVCSDSAISCPTDPDPLDCWMYQCQPGNGSCVLVPRPDSSPCSDRDSCTLNDVCVAGECVGEPRVCTSPHECQVGYCSLGSCATLPLSGNPCDFDNNTCTDDVCVNGQCIQGTPKSCSHLDSLDRCTVGVCDKQSGDCFSELKDGDPCSDGDTCTYQDQCIEGVCVGVPDPSKGDLEICGGTPPKDDNTTPIIISFAAAGAAALIGLIVGFAFLAKRVKNSKLMDPDTWNPDTFSTVGANPMYKASETVVDNRLYEASS